MNRQLQQLIIEQKMLCITLKMVKFSTVNKQIIIIYKKAEREIKREKNILEINRRFLRLFY